MKKYLSYSTILALVLTSTASAQYAPVPLPPPTAVDVAPQGPPPSVPIDGAPIPAAPYPGMDPIVVGVDPTCHTCNSPCNDCCGGGGMHWLTKWFSGWGNHCGTWTAGGGAYYLQPVFESNPAFTITGVGSVNQIDFAHDMQAAPLAFLGYTWESGFGVRGRWYHINANGNASAGPINATQSFVFPSNSALATPLVVNTTGSAAVGTSNLKLHVWDLEGTYAFNAGCWQLNSSAGVRYAHMSQDYLVNIVSAAGAVTDQVGSGHNFNGAGPTFSLEGVRPICNSCFALYGSFRTSLLFGSSQSTASVVLPNAVGGAVAFNSSASSTDIINITELEVGGKWSGRWGCWSPFVQLGFVGQAWLGGGNASQGITQNDNGTNFGFVGGVARIGVNF